MPDGSQRMTSLFKRFAIDFSLTCRVPVTINDDKTFNFSDIRKYASLMFTADQQARLRGLSASGRSSDAIRHTSTSRSLQGTTMTFPVRGDGA